MAACRIEELGHTAEVGIGVGASSPQELFACAAHGMFALLHGPIESGLPTSRRTLIVESIDQESLLVDWLNELLYLYTTNGNDYRQCDVTEWSPTRLEATLAGCPPQSPPAMEIKAVTYHQVRVAEIEQEWIAEVYFDI